MSDQWQHAVVDRIKDGRHAVMLVDYAEEKVVSVDQLPEGTTNGTWLRVRLNGDDLVEAEIDHEAGQRVRERVRVKMERLRRRGRHDERTIN